MSEKSRFNRRSVLKTLGATGVAVGAGGAGIFAATGGAAAQAALDVSIDDSEYHGDQGLVDWVGVDVQKVFTWENFDVPLRYVRFDHEITLDNATIDGSTGWHTLYNKRSGRLTDWSSKGNGSDGWGGPGEYVSHHNGDKADYLNGRFVADVVWAVISNGKHPGGYDSVQTPVDWAEYVSVDEDGATKTRTVKWDTTLTLYTENENDKAVQIDDSDGIPEVSGRDTFDVLVENEPSATGGQSSGDSSNG